ncbi:MAG: rRNA pseudouridine synthase [Bdellovibrionales bacterium]|nr:rRNA pseudouridine synthase [Bdellovibrionales bacterium]
MPKTTASEIRLNRFLAQAGLCSRRKADEWIEEGRVQVNGKTVYELGLRVSPQDRITVDHKPVRSEEPKVYLAFFKPINVLTTLSDPEERPCLTDFLPRNLKTRVFPVGRLDWDSEGLLLLTNDGDFAQMVAHPEKGVPKTYLVKLDGKPTDNQFLKLKKGVSIPGGKARALNVKRVRHGDSSKYDWVQITIDEGRNRQVRKMFEKIGFDVKKLRRVAIGSYKLGTMKAGQIITLSRLDLARVLTPPQDLRPRPVRKKKTSMKRKVSRS